MLAHHGAGNVDAIGGGVREEVVPGAVVAHHGEQRDRHAELRDADRLVRTFAAEHLVPRAHRGRGARRRGVRHAQDEVAGDLPDHDHLWCHGGSSTRFRIGLINPNGLISARGRRRPRYGERCQGAGWPARRPAERAAGASRAGHRP